MTCTTCDWLGGGKCIDPEGCKKISPSYKQLGFSFVSHKSDDSGDEETDNKKDNRQRKH